MTSPIPVSGALDLSSKSSPPSADTWEGSRPPGSPALSYSDGDDGRDSPPTAGPNDHFPNGQQFAHRLHQAAARPRSDSLSSPESPAADDANGDASATGSRPFKRYPFDPLQGMYSQMAATSASGLSAMPGLNPMAAAAAANMAAMASMGGLGGMGSAPGSLPPPLGLGALSPGSTNDLYPPLSMTSSISQYLSQRKRRTDSREQRDKPGGNGVGSTSSGAPLMMPSLEHQPIFPGQSLSAQHAAMQIPTQANKRIKTEPMTSPSSAASSETDQQKDAAYWERRRKNNEAAKRSRDARRAKEEEIALRAAFLEQENLKLRAQVTILKNETAKLHYMLYNRA